MRGHNICSVIRKIIFELSSILPLIWSSDMALIGPVLEAIQGLHSLPMSYLWDASINGLT